MEYTVVDFYKNPFGEAIYLADSEEDAREFCKMYLEDTDGECLLKVYNSQKKLEFVCRRR